jgi:transposase-like protein
MVADGAIVRRDGVKTPFESRELNRAAIIGSLIDNGGNVSRTARTIGVARNTVKLARRKFESYGEVADAPRTGRPRVVRS